MYYPKMSGQNYVAPKKPKKGARVHTFPFSHNGVIRALVQESKTFWVGLVRFWNPDKRRYYWEPINSISWEFGLVRPGKAKKVDRRFSLRQTGSLNLEKSK